MLKFLLVMVVFMSTCFAAEEYFPCRLSSDFVFSEDVTVGASIFSCETIVNFKLKGKDVLIPAGSVVIGHVLTGDFSTGELTAQSSIVITKDSQHILGGKLLAGDGNSVRGIVLYDSKILAGRFSSYFAKSYFNDKSGSDVRAQLPEMEAKKSRQIVMPKNVSILMEN